MRRPRKLLRLKNRWGEGEGKEQEGGINPLHTKSHGPSRPCVQKFPPLTTERGEELSGSLCLAGWIPLIIRVYLVRNGSRVFSPVRKKKVKNNYETREKTPREENFRIFVPENFRTKHVRSEHGSTGNIFSPSPCSDLPRCCAPVNRLVVYGYFLSSVMCAVCPFCSLLPPPTPLCFLFHYFNIQNTFRVFLLFCIQLFFPHLFITWFFFLQNKFRPFLFFTKWDYFFGLHMRRILSLNGKLGVSEQSIIVVKWTVEFTKEGAPICPPKAQSPKL